MYVGALSFSFLFEFTQTYLMQWAGQKAMFDMRTQIFAHLQELHVGFFDKNPVGRLVTRVTSDVDALNDMFTGGVVAIFEDIFVLAASSSSCSHELAAGADHVRGVASHLLRHGRSSARKCGSHTARYAPPSRASTLTCKSM